MIFAELHGKLGENYSRAHERAEDLLTSTVFGLLRYLPPADGLLTVLRRVRWTSLEDGEIRVRPGPLGTDEIASFRLDFWPRWAGYGEPDVLVRLLDAADAVRSVVVIEAKLHSPKSGRPGDEDEGPAYEGQPDPDQLARYWQGLQRLGEVNEGVPASLIYLTRHATPPLEELAESLRQRPSMRLGWLSWRDVWAVARSLPRTNLPAADLADLLAHKGLKDFDGFRRKVWLGPASGRFWIRRGWFAQKTTWRPPTATRFWRAEG